VGNPGCPLFMRGGYERKNGKSGRPRVSCKCLVLRRPGGGPRLTAKGRRQLTALVDEKKYYEEKGKRRGGAGGTTRRGPDGKYPGNTQGAKSRKITKRRSVYRDKRASKGGLGDSDLKHIT